MWLLHEKKTEKSKLAAATFESVRSTIISNVNALPAKLFLTAKINDAGRS